MKKNKKIADEKKENLWSTFWINYKNNPLFKALVKLGLYFIFFMILIIIASIANISENSNEDKYRETTTKKIETISYKDILDDIRNNNLEYNVEVTNNDNISIISGNITKKEIIGFIENQDKTTKFKIVDNNIYEIILKSEILNNELFNNINLDYIILNKMIDILENNKFTRLEEENVIKYIYNIDDTNILVIIKENKIVNIEIKEENNKYIINYKY